MLFDNLVETTRTCVYYSGHFKRRSFSPLAVRGQLLRYVAFLQELLHGVGGGRLPGAGMLEAAGVLLVQRLFSPGVKCKAETCQGDDFHQEVRTSVAC